MAAQYFLYVDQQYGPYDLVLMQKYVKDGIVANHSWVHCEGETKDWTRASDVASLKALFQPAAPVPSVAPGLAAKLKKASESGAEPAEGTMLVGPSAIGAVRMMPTVLPNAPHSDIEQVKKASAEVVADAEKASKPGLFARLKSLLSRKKS